MGQVAPACTALCSRPSCFSGLSWTDAWRCTSGCGRSPSVWRICCWLRVMPRAKGICSTHVESGVSRWQAGP